MITVLGVASAQAVVVFTSTAADIVLGQDVSIPTGSVATDLFQTSLTSTTFPVANNINNGTTGLQGEDTGGVNPAVVVLAGTYDFTLDLGASSDGYDISQINSYTGWNDNRAGQAYTISFSTVAAPTTFTQITPGGTGNDAVSVGASNQSLVTNVFDDGGALLGTGVAVIRFDVGVNGAENVWREIDAIGVPTVVVPEPSAFALLGLASLGLGLRRRRA